MLDLISQKLVMWHNVFLSARFTKRERFNLVTCPALHFLMRLQLTAAVNCRASTERIRRDVGQGVGALVLLQPLGTSWTSRIAAGPARRVVRKTGFSWNNLILLQPWLICVLLADENKVCLCWRVFMFCVVIKKKYLCCFSVYLCKGTGVQVVSRGQIWMG